MYLANVSCMWAFQKALPRVAVRSAKIRAPSFGFFGRS